MENIKLFCVSLGCDKNLVDTEKMLGLLNGRGITFTDDETEAVSYTHLDVYKRQLTIYYSFYLRVSFLPFL